MTFIAISINSCATARRTNVTVQREAWQNQLPHQSDHIGIITTNDIDVPYAAENRLPRLEQMVMRRYHVSRHPTAANVYCVKCPSCEIAGTPMYSLLLPDIISK